MRKIMLTTLAVVALATVAGADILWDQAEADMSAPGFFNSESGSPPFGMTMFTVSDILVDDVWNVTTITTYWSILDEGFANLTEGYLHVFPKTGPLPAETDDPTLSLLVPMSATVESNTGTLVCGDLDLGLEPGEYWIGITPIAAAPFGPEVHLSSTINWGDASPSYDPYAFPGPPAWFNFTPDHDATILIEGAVTVATEARSLTDVKTLFR